MTSLEADDPSAKASKNLMADTRLYPPVKGLALNPDEDHSKSSFRRRHSELDEDEEQPDPNVTSNHGGHEREGDPINNNRTPDPDHKMSFTPSLLGRFCFPFWFLTALYEFFIFIHKLYQDSSAVHTYYHEGNRNHLILSVVALTSPPLLYVIFILGSRFAKPGVVACGDWFTGLINGMLLIPWQIKGRAEVLHFTSQRICARRKPTKEECDSVDTLGRQASVLEFFEKFYAGFLQLVLQLYILIVLADGAKKDASKPLVGELVASSLALVSTALAVKRRDDGILTGTLSVIGWLSFFTSRFLALSLASTIIYGWMAFLCLIHVITMTVWISSIAFQSYKIPDPDSNETPDPLTTRRKASIFFLVFAVFGLPSVAFWPIMFNLKERNRPLIFVFICVLENTACYVLWFVFKKLMNNQVEAKMNFNNNDIVMTALVFGGMAIGSLCILLYSTCKPKLTDQIVMHDMKVNNANSYGIFYDFCEATFKLPKTDKVHNDLEKLRNI